MSELEKMKRYIERTKMDASLMSLYGINIAEAMELAHSAYTHSDLPIDTISLAFSYGMAKGYRAAKAGMLK